MLAHSSPHVQPDLLFTVYFWPATCMLNSSDVFLRCLVSAPVCQDLVAEPVRSVEHCSGVIQKSSVMVRFKMCLFVSLSIQLSRLLDCWLVFFLYNSLSICPAVFLFLCLVGCLSSCLSVFFSVSDATVDSVAQCTGNVEFNAIFKLGQSQLCTAVMKQQKQQ